MCMGQIWRRGYFSQLLRDISTLSTLLDWRANEETIKIKSNVCCGWDKYVGEIALRSLASRQQWGKVSLRYQSFSTPFCLKYGGHNSTCIHLINGLINARLKGRFKIIKIVGHESCIKKSWQEGRKCWSVSQRKAVLPASQQEKKTDVEDNGLEKSLRSLFCTRMMLF